MGGQWNRHLGPARRQLDHPQHHVLDAEEKFFSGKEGFEDDLLRTADKFRKARTSEIDEIVAQTRLAEEIRHARLEGFGIQCEQARKIRREEVSIEQCGDGVGRFLLAAPRRPREDGRQRVGPDEL